MLERHANQKNPRRTQIFVLSGGLFLGGIGFLAGFIGPLLLSPEANQGPLLGIFITGPVGLLLGGGLGMLAAGRQWHFALFVVALFIGSAIVCSTTLYLSLPDDQYQGSILDSTISKCEASSSLKRPAAETVPGVVLTVQLHRNRNILEKRKPWNRGQLALSEWQPERGVARFLARYAGETCDTYPIGQRRSFFKKWENEMGLFVVGNIPERFARFRE